MLKSHIRKAERHWSVRFSRCRVADMRELQLFPFRLLSALSKKELFVQRRKTIFKKNDKSSLW